jgi:peptidoglycan/LPS O-acetylase OafA/YrhL
MAGRRRNSYELDNHLSTISPALPPFETNRKRSTAFLDGVRGLAALFVFIQHYIGSFDLNVHEHGYGESGTYYYLASLPFVRIIFNGGNSGVAVFFVLSGYVLSQSPLRLLLEKRRDACRLSLLSAVVRRPLRLYISPLCISFLVALWMHLPWGIWPESIWTPENTISSEVGKWVTESIAFFNPFRTHSDHQAWYRYNLVMWTIPIELKGSMLTYGLVALEVYVRRSGFAFVVCEVITVYTLLQLGYWTMACFIAGLILSYIDIFSLDAHLLSRFTTTMRSIWFTSIFFIGYYLLCQPAHSGSPEYSSNTPGWRWLSELTPSIYNADQYYRYWHSWGAALFIYAALNIDWLQRLFSIRPLRYLGHVSFMLYLIHLPLLYIFGDRIRRAVGVNHPGAGISWWDNKLWMPDWGPPGFNIRFLVSLAIMSVICLPTADIMTRFVDKPSVRLGKKITAKIGLETKKGEVVRTH